MEHQPITKPLGVTYQEEVPENESLKVFELGRGNGLRQSHGPCVVLEIERQAAVSEVWP